MPRWFTHGKAFTALRRRYNLNEDAREFLTGLLPVIEADRHWTADRLNLWGIFTQHALPGGIGPVYPAASLHAQRKELLVHRIQATLRIGGSWSSVPGYGFHLFSPLQTYVPELNRAAIWFPWAQTMVEPADAGQLSEGFGLTGDNAAQQVVLVNGVPYTSIGPVGFAPWVITFVGATGGGYAYSAQPELQTLWSFQDPPLRVRPFSALTVQTTSAMGPSGSIWTLDVNWWYSEREDVGRVG